MAPFIEKVPEINGVKADNRNFENESDLTVEGKCLSKFTLPVYTIGEGLVRGLDSKSIRVNQERSFSCNDSS